MKFSVAPLSMRAFPATVTRWCRNVIDIFKAFTVLVYIRSRRIAHTQVARVEPVKNPVLHTNRQAIWCVLHHSSTVLGQGQPLHSLLVPLVVKWVHRMQALALSRLLLLK
jgi:hypothetical protein